HQMDHPVCEQGESDAHLLLRAACASLGQVRRKTGERRSLKTLNEIQEELGWPKWSRIRSALEDLEEAAHDVVAVENNVLHVQRGSECSCSRPRVLDKESPRSIARARARGNPRPPASPIPLPSASVDGRAHPGSSAMRRIEDSSEATGEDQASPVVIA